MLNCPLVIISRVTLPLSLLPSSDSVCNEYRSILSLWKPVHCGSILSPCGGLVFAGGEGGNVTVWDTDTGQPVHTYSSLPLSSFVSALAYHPHQHMVAFSAFGPHQSLVVFMWEGCRKDSTPTNLQGTSQRLEQVRQTLTRVSNTTTS